MSYNSKVYKGTEYPEMKTSEFDLGFIVEYSEKEVMCHR
jgi:hypothetical protein